MKRFEALLFAGALVAAAGCNTSSVSPFPGPTSPSGGKIQHIIVMVQENRSFDNIFAGFPGANTTLEGACKPGPKWCPASHKIRLRSVPLESTGKPNFGTDIDHSHHGFEIECDANASNVCQNDGFDMIRYGESGQGAPAKTYPYAYVERSETKNYWTLAKDFSLADDMLFTETASSFISHQVMLSGSVEINNHESLTDQPNTFPWGCDAPPGTHTPVLFKDGHYSYDGPFPCFTYPTIADLLDAKNVSWCDYVDADSGKDSDFSGATWNGYRAIKKIFHGPDWKTNICSPNTTIFSDLKDGKLPSVSWVIPGLYQSDHPAAGCNGGPWWVTRVVNAIGTSQYWKNTAIVLIWDDWGGWYDNVPPPQIWYTRLGFRVPMIVISPYSQAGDISHTQYDFGSILLFMEQTFGLGSLNTTDATANSMQDIFNFNQSPLSYTPLPIPSVKKACTKRASLGSARQVIEHDGGVPE